MTTPTRSEPPAAIVSHGLPHPPPCFTDSDQDDRAEVLAARAEALEVISFVDPVALPR